MKKTTTRSWRNFGFWIPVAIFLAAFAVVRQTVTSAYERQRQLQTSAYQQDRALGEVAETKANEVLQDYRRKFGVDPPISYAEEALNGGVKLPVYNRAMIWTDDQGGQASLEIEDAHWVGTRPGGRYAPSTPLALASVNQLVCNTTGAALASSVSVWLLLAVITAGTSIPFHKRPRKVLGALCIHLLLLAIVTLILAILDASDNWTYYRRDLTPGVFAGLAFVTLSIVFLIISGRRVHAYPRCDKCGYNLTKNVSGTCPECGKFMIEAF